MGLIRLRGLTVHGTHRCGGTYSDGTHWCGRTHSNRTHRSKGTYCRLDSPAYCDSLGQDSFLGRLTLEWTHSGFNDLARLTIDRSHWRGGTHSHGTHRSEEDLLSIELTSLRGLTVDRPHQPDQNHSSGDSLW